MATREHAPHESLFLKVKDKENTKDFLREHLPEGILEHADLNSLYLENVSYLDDNLRKHFSDLVFSSLMKNPFLAGRSKISSDGLKKIQGPILLYLPLAQPCDAPGRNLLLFH